jgi:hypothetical protein
MPNWLRRQILDGPTTRHHNIILPDGTLGRVTSIENETPDLIPLLAYLSSQDPTVTRAYFCRPEIRHICKIPREGGFCGYRNIQMLSSFLRHPDVKATYGLNILPHGIPNILELQNMIEHAWDLGFNSHGRLETGGIRGTRKYIGTPEVGAHLGITPCDCRLTGAAGTSLLS